MGFKSFRTLSGEASFSSCLFRIPNSIPIVATVITHRSCHMVACIAAAVALGGHSFFHHILTRRGLLLLLLPRRRPFSFIIAAAMAPAYLSSPRPWWDISFYLGTSIEF